jgi:hypothetical protein
MTDLRCLDASDRSPCEGDVEMRMTSDRTDGKHFPRCEKHYDAREAKSAHNLELMSPARPSWFDEGYAGERWDDEY